MKHSSETFEFVHLFRQHLSLGALYPDCYSITCKVGPRSECYHSRIPVYAEAKRSNTAMGEHHQTMYIPDEDSSYTLPQTSSINLK